MTLYIFFEVLQNGYFPFQENALLSTKNFISFILKILLSVRITKILEITEYHRNNWRQQNPTFKIIIET